MSDYVKSTDFASKDTLPSGDSAKIVRGTEIDAEFEALEVAIATKANTSDVSSTYAPLNSPTFTGSPVLPTGTTAVTQTAGDNDTSVATTAFVTTAVAALGYPAFKNRIINGAMMIDQRNAGASVTPVNSGYMVDRWTTYLSQASKITSQRDTTAPSGFINSLKLTVSAAVTPGASDFFAIAQKVEGFNASDLGFGTSSAQSVTLSFWVRSSITGTYAVRFCNSAFNRSYIATYTINSANTWEQKTITIAGDTSGTWLTDNGIGVNVQWDLGSGSNGNGTAGSWTGSDVFRTSSSTNWISTNGATFYITGVQLEKGSTATSFDYRPYGTELALCQRYYQRINNWVGLCEGTTSIAANAQFFVPMRASATVTKITGSTLSWRTVSADNTSTTWAFSAANGQPTSVWFQISSVTGLTSGQATHNRGYGTDIAEASAEL